MQVSHTVTAVFDDRNLIGHAGLIPLLGLAQRAGLHDLIDTQLTVSSPNPVAKATSVVAGMLCGADSFDDLDVLRHGGTGRVFTGVRAPSTLGTFLRSFTFGHVRQLDAVNSRFLGNLCTRVPGLLAGAAALSFLDLDDSVREVHGYAKQGAAYAYTKVKGLNMQLAALSTPVAAPLIAATRLRKGNVASGHGGPRILADAVAAARACGATGRVLVRADSGYCDAKTVGAAVAAGVWFSITARQNTRVRAAIAAIPDTAWAAIKYPRAVFDEPTGMWISDAQVAETEFVAFASRPDHQVTCRLVVRRVRALPPGAQAVTSGDAAPVGTAEDGGAGQGELFPVWRHHAFLTNSGFSTVDADRYHRDHAVIEQVIAELKDGPMAHCPSGKFTANAAWLALAVTAFNLTRAAGVLASRRHAIARTATIRRHLIAVPGRVATSARKITVHLPTEWPWAVSFSNLFTAANTPPPAAAA